MERMHKLGLLACAALLWAPLASAQVYKCVGADGKPTYSQSPCPPGTSSKTLIRRAPATEDEPEAKPGEKAGGKPPAKPLTPEEAFQKRQKEREEAEQKASAKAAEEKRRQDECARAREQVAQYNIGGRITRVDAQGERYYLDEAQIAQERARAEAVAAQMCR
ncbi:MAG TPA: DUF4124 domain-containing protein [Burkholderiales bacterium]|nr:DUF4124 domain-containing protein [Burkholderiales bacterium]